MDQERALERVITETVTELARQRNAYVPHLMLACEGLQNFQLNPERDHTIYTIYNALSVYFTDGDRGAGKKEALTFIHQVLLVCNRCIETGLEPFLLEESYDARVKYPEVDIRLTTMELTCSLRRSEKRMLRRYLQDREGGVPDYEMKDVVSLTKAMFAESVVQGIGDLHRVATCFGRQKIDTCAFLRRQGIDRPIEDLPATLDVESLRIRGTAYSNPLLFWCHYI